MFCNTADWEGTRHLHSKQELHTLHAVHARPKLGQPGPPLCRACSERPGRNQREVKQGKSQQNQRTRLPRLQVVKDWDGAQRLWSPQHWRQVRPDWRQPHATCSEAARLRAGLDHAVCNHPCSAGAALGPSNDRVWQRLLQRVRGTARSTQMLPQIASIQYAAALAPNSR